MEVANTSNKSLTETCTRFLLVVLGGLFLLLCLVSPHFPPNLRWLGGFQTSVFAFLSFLTACWIQIPRLQWQKVWFPTTLGILAFPFFCFALGSTGFLFGFSITRWHGILAFLLTLVSMAYVAESRRSFAFSCLVFAAVWCFSLFFSVLSCEHREDGMMYHKPASIMISKGWNPVWEENLSEYVTEHDGNIEMFRYSHVAFFPKGLWVVTATLHLMTGTVESGTSVYLAMMIACVILFYFMLREWFLKPRWAALLGGSLLAMNSDIIQEEIFSGMIDGPLALCLLTFLLAGILWLRTNRSVWLPFFIGSAVFGCSMKHNAPVFFALMGSCLTLVYLIRWSQKKWGAFFKEYFHYKTVPFANPLPPEEAVSGLESPSGAETPSTSDENPEKMASSVRVPFRNWLLALFCIPTFVAVFCFNPFITNFLFHSSPFYPLHTLNEKDHPKEDILGIYYARPDFAEASRSQRFLYTFLLNRIFFVSALSQDPPVYTPGGIHFLKFGLSYRKNFPIGIFPITLILTIPFLFFVRRWDFWLMVLTIIASTAIHPHNWWGRFVPQLWALPVLVSCFVLYELPLTGKSFSSSFLKSWLFRWNILIYGLLIWCFWISFYLFSFFCVSQLHENAALVAQIEEVKAQPSVVMVGGFTEKTSKGELQVCSHPRYLYYMQDLMRNFGCRNVYYSVLNCTLPEEVKDFNIYRCVFLYPEENKKTEAGENSSEEKRQTSITYGLRKIFAFREEQFLRAWGSGLYPVSAGTVQDEVSPKPLPQWIINLKKRDETELPRDFEDLMNTDFEKP